MAKTAQELYDALKSMGHAGDAVLPGIVKKVNADDTIDVQIGSLVFYDVRLKAAVVSGAKGIKPKPAVGSVVVIERVGDAKSDEYQVALFSDLDEWSIEIGTAGLLLADDGLLVKRGGDTLKQALNMIVEAVQKIVVLQGTNPDQVKLAQAKIKINKLLK